MFDSILKRMCESIRTRQYVMTLHAEDEMNDDGLSIFDVESGILTGKIIERQKDKLTGESKYLISGKTLTDNPIAVVCKLGLTGKLVIITVYLDESE